MLDSKLLIVGLGNIGKEYENTRHNVGFDVIDKLAEKLEIDFSNQKKLSAQVAIGELMILAKPDTFMNRSGVSVAKIKEYYKVSAENIILVCDDFNLDLGKVRVRFDGESGGHNGLESVMEQVSPNFWRIRIGIGETGSKPAEKFVLEKFTKGERDIVNAAVDKTVQYMVDLTFEGELRNESFNVGPSG